MKYIICIRGEKAYLFTGTALDICHMSYWYSQSQTSQNIPSPASRESPALGGWRNREEKLSPVTTLSPLWQRYSSGIVRDPDLLTAQTKHWYSYTSGWKCSDWQSSFYILVSLEEEKSRDCSQEWQQAARNISQLSHWPDMRHAGLSLVSLVTRSLVTRDRERSKIVFTALRFLHSNIRATSDAMLLYLLTAA